MPWRPVNSVLHTRGGAHRFEPAGEAGGPRPMTMPELACTLVTPRHSIRSDHG